MEGIIIRAMYPRDLPEVCAVARRCFTTPWRFSAFDSELKNNDAFLKAALFNGKITGYVCMRCICDVIHIMDIAVVPEFRRAGTGTLLLTKALQEICETRPEISHVTLEVRESNISAISFYEKSSFAKTGKRRLYYKKPPEDAVIMQRDLQPDNSILKS